jgi:Big-like domain-containing protein
MEGKKPRAGRVGRLSRAALFVGVATATAGAMVFGAGAAFAGVGKDPGTLALSPTTGATSSTPTWATTQGCASGFQGSAVLRIEEGGGATFSMSGAVNSGLAGSFAGTLLDPISTIATVAGLANGGTDEMVVFCYSGSGLTGTSDPEMSEYLTLSADGSTYSTSSSGPAGPVSTTTSLIASPNPAQVGATVTLTATESAADSTNPAGSVQFESGGTAIGTAVAVNGSGVATTTTTFSAAATVSLSAVFTPTNTTGYSGSTGTYSETVTTTNPNSGSEPISVSVPASGSFTLTVATGTVNLSVSGANATGALNPVTVSDTRNTFPGWQVTGQESTFNGSGTAAGSSISGNQLGWVPTDTSLGTGVTLGPTVTAASPGLGTTAGVLAQAAAPSGTGTSVLGANLTLAIPASAAAGPYAGTMTITAVTAFV